MENEPTFFERQTISGRRVPFLRTLILFLFPIPITPHHNHSVKHRNRQMVSKFFCLFFFFCHTVPLGDK